MFSDDLIITASNHSVEELCGWKPTELIGKSLDFLFRTGDDQQPFWNTSGKAPQEIRKYPAALQNRSGELISSTISLSPLLNEKGQQMGGIITFHDDGAALQNQIILASIADGIFTVDRNWTITSFNRAAEKITGWDDNEAIGRPCSEIFRSSFCGEECPVATSLYSGQAVASHVITITSRDGRSIPVSVSASPLVDSEGNIIGGVETFRDLSEAHIVRRPPRKRSTFGDVISKNSAMRRIFEILPEIARSDSNVIILGESGTGKELVARATHASSNRRKGPFVTVNCGALPDTLLESELFGYKAGAFTDAKHDRPGRFAAAEKGTIFLDEIGDIPASLQVKLLRVLQERVYEPLGSNTSIKADVRVIAATNRDLLTLVGQGLFRDDLYYRLNVVKLLLPPLRERKEDIPMLCQHFIKTFCTRQGKEITGISEPAMDILMRYNFPGNIRELENVIEYAFILCHGGLIMPQHLPEPLAPQGVAAANKNSPAPRSLDELEKQAIYATLERNGWRKIMTCRELGISKDTLRRKIQKYQLSGPDDPDLPEE
ncbi:MAG: sigma 54-interacting transcriptional regulator [Desulfobulbaceae bacterium]|nr:sigma 54-interacting transcriptional regulator [Desulfobulbaceae bacterium]